MLESRNLSWDQQTKNETILGNQQKREEPEKQKTELLKQIKQKYEKLSLHQ